MALSNTRRGGDLKGTPIDFICLAGCECGKIRRFKRQRQRDLSFRPLAACGTRKILAQGRRGMFRLLRQQIKNASIILPTLLFAASQFAGYASAADESAFELPDWRFKFVKKVEYDNRVGYSNRYESAKAKIDEYFLYRGPRHPELLKRISAK